MKKAMRLMTVCICYLMLAGASHAQTKSERAATAVKNSNKDSMLNFVEQRAAHCDSSKACRKIYKSPLPARVQTNYTDYEETSVKDSTVKDALVSAYTAKDTILTTRMKRISSKRVVELQEMYSAVTGNYTYFIYSRSPGSDDWHPIVISTDGRDMYKIDDAEASKLFSLY